MDLSILADYINMTGEIQGLNDFIAGGALGVLIGAILVFLIIFFIAYWIYTSFAWMKIAKKLKCKKSWLAWIPIARYFLYPILNKKHWTWGFFILVPIANVVFYFIWTWHIFEKRKYSGWLALIPLAGMVPGFSMASNIAYLIALGFVAWKDRRK